VRPAVGTFRARDGADDLASGHLGTGADDGNQWLVGGLDVGAVGNGHNPAAGNVAGEGDPAGTRRTDRLADPGAQVDPPVPSRVGVGGGGEGAEDPDRSHRWGEPVCVAAGKADRRGRGDGSGKGDGRGKADGSGKGDGRGKADGNDGGRRGDGCPGEQPSTGDNGQQTPVGGPRAARRQERAAGGRAKAQAHGGHRWTVRPGEGSHSGESRGSGRPGRVGGRRPHLESARALSGDIAWPRPDRPVGAGARSAPRR